MKATYLALFSGIILTFLIVVGAVVAAFWPYNIPTDETVTVIPSSVKAGSIISYKINGCVEGKYHGVTSVNVQSLDTPPSVTVALSAPAPQDRLPCRNATLIPAPLPTGDYRVIVYVIYRTNPIRDFFNPIKKPYVSNVIHVKNANPNYTLPKVADTVQGTTIEPSQKQTIVADEVPAEKKPTVNDAPSAPAVQQPKENQSIVKEVTQWLTLTK